MNYVRFGAMIVTSTIVMFILMYLNTYALDHVYFSETRAYMALVMGPPWPSSCSRSCLACTKTRR